MAKNGKSKKEPAMLMPSASKLRELSSLHETAKQNSDRANQKYRDALALAEEKNHLDKLAFSISERVKKLSDERVRITYYHLLTYLEANGVEKRATDQQEMFEEHVAPKKKKNGEAEKDGEQTEGNVTHIGTAARKVAETAGEKMGA